jgi:hypothetical protein
MAAMLHASVRSYGDALGDPATCSIQPRPSLPLPLIYQ